MGWIGSLTESSAVGSSTRWEPNSPESTDPNTTWVNVKTYAGNYSVGTFKAPKRGVYRFDLKGSGGAKVTTRDTSHSSGNNGGSSGGEGGSTTGYLLLEKNQEVYVGAGGVCRAAFVSSAYGANLAAVSIANLFLVAGAGGSGASWYDRPNGNGYNCKTDVGGNGGGTSGAAGSTKNSIDTDSGKGGTQSAGGAGGTSDSDLNKANGSAGKRGVGGNGSEISGDGYIAYGGRGGDGFYGGGGASCSAADNGVSAAGGGGGSGYVKNKTLTVVGKPYTSSTSQGGGASSNNPGSVTVTYYAIADIPVIFNGTRLTAIIFNGTRITGLIKDGTRIFARRWKAWRFRFWEEQYGSREAKLT